MIGRNLCDRTLKRHAIGAIASGPSPFPRLRQDAAEFINVLTRRHFRGVLPLGVSAFEDLWRQDRGVRTQCRRQASVGEPHLLQQGARRDRLFARGFRSSLPGKPIRMPVSGTARQAARYRRIYPNYIQIMASRSRASRPSPISREEPFRRRTEVGHGIERPGDPRRRRHEL